MHNFRHGERFAINRRYANNANVDVGDTGVVTHLHRHPDLRGPGCGVRMANRNEWYISEDFMDKMEE